MDYDMITSPTLRIENAGGLILDMLQAESQKKRAPYRVYLADPSALRFS